MPGRLTKTWSVLLCCDTGRFMVFLVEAMDQNIAIDACIRSAKLECPSNTFSMTQASEITLNSPMKVMDTGDEPFMVANSRTNTQE